MKSLPLLESVPERTRGCCEDLPALLTAQRASEVADAVRALSDPTRVQMVHVLKHASEPICVCDFTAAFDLGQPTVSHHIAKLRQAGFVESYKQGIWTFYRLSRDMPEELKRIVALIP